jgi:GntR family transcriptional regulator, transcriptional repressor for pyruvate dehydrogenase complex
MDRSQARAARPRTVKLTELIARRVVDDIVTRDLQPGAPLSTEADMASDFDVSRATVREALRILESNGLIRIRAGRYGGPQVGEVDPVAFGRSLTWFLQMRRTRFWELLEARVMLEPMMAALAAERRSVAALEELSAAIEAHRRLDPSDNAGYLASTQDFHGVIAGISGNGVLDLFGRALKEIYTERAIAAEQPASRREAVLREHEAVVDAILAGDRGRAEDSMRQHMEELAAGFKRSYAALREDFVGWW